MVSLWVAGHILRLRVGALPATPAQNVIGIGRVWGGRINATPQPMGAQTVCGMSSDPPISPHLRGGWAQGRIMETTRIDKARIAYDKARHGLCFDGKLVHRTALELVRAWAEYDKAHHESQ